MRQGSRDASSVPGHLGVKSRFATRTAFPPGRMVASSRTGVRQEIAGGVARGQVKRVRTPTRARSIRRSPSPGHELPPRLGPPGPVNPCGNDTGDGLPLPSRSFPSAEPRVPPKTPSDFEEQRGALQKPLLTPGSSTNVVVGLARQGLLLDRLLPRTP